MLTAVKAGTRPHMLSLQSHASYSRCGLGSEGTDRLVALVRAEQAAALATGKQPALFGAKITGGGSGGKHLLSDSHRGCLVPQLSESRCRTDGPSTKWASLANDCLLP